MKIKRIKVHNWRSIKDVEISFENLMVIIGQNNHGKSNILSAILFFFGAQTCTDLDFTKGEDELFVEITFSDLDYHDQTQFSKYLTQEKTITVRKEIKKGLTHEYHGYTQTPSDDWLKEESISSYLSRDVISATPLNQYIPAQGRITKEVVRQAQQEYLAEHADLVNLTYSLESGAFMGFKSVAQGIFGDVFFVPAVKNASEEFNVKGKSIFNQLLTNVINDMSASNEEYIEAKKRVRELTQILNKSIEDGTPNTKRPEQIVQLEQLLESELSSWDTTIDIEITPPDVDEVLKVGTNVWLNDGISTDVNRKGNGLQRSLIFALIKSWAKVLKNQKGASSNSNGRTNEESGRRSSRSTYFIFEEPELYLHPQAQRELYESLKELSGSNNQVILTTHSSSFIDLELHKSICIVYKNNPIEGTKHLQCSDDLFSEIDDKKKFNLTYWVNPDRGELFFAKKVILTEGPTEKSLIPLLAKKLGIYKYDYTLIECGSKEAIPIYIHLLNSFRKPYVVVYDKDNQLGKDEQAINTANKTSLLIEEKIDTTYGKSVVFENDIEEEIGLLTGSSKNKPYKAIEHVSVDGFNLSKQLEDKILSIYN